MEFETSLRTSPEPCIGPYSVQHNSRPRPSHIFFSCVPVSFQWSVSFRQSARNFISIQ